MSTKEEIEAAIDRRVTGTTPDGHRWMDDDALLADAYIVERERLAHESTTPPTRELYDAVVPMLCPG